ncbi:Helix-turn-helix domain-containing protein (fragment) [Xenorhabdus cabanillasii JM26]|uniref:Helix-turn-helix domain-containing protein n=1 Tax=Xenorhabdus cabanillasii JM26 TaxID=1427517 RepID=W1IP77_9GAMM
MEQSGLTVKDLEPAIGKSNRVYEALNSALNVISEIITAITQKTLKPINSYINNQI